jgi:hypothetical protein
MGGKEALKEIVEELVENRKRQQLPVGCVHDVDEDQAQLQEKMEYQPGA